MHVCKISLHLVSVDKLNSNFTREGKISFLSIFSRLCTIFYNFVASPLANLSSKGDCGTSQNSDLDV